MKLAGGTVLITGASQGLGAATARAIAARGAEVVLLTCGEDKPRNVAAKIDAHGVVEECSVTAASRSVKLRARLGRSGGRVKEQRLLPRGCERHGGRFPTLASDDEQEGRSDGRFATNGAVASKLAPGAR